MQTKPFDLSKCQKDSAGHLTCTTRDGRKVRILATDCGGSKPIAAQIIHANGKPQLLSYRAGGSLLGEPESVLDLIKWQED